MPFIKVFRPRGARLSHLAIALFSLTLPAACASFSFQGTFAHDNDVQYFSFNLLSAGTVTLQTLGYGGSADSPGGTNAAGNIILPGGFEPVLQVYDAATGAAAAGTFFPGISSSCGPSTPDLTRIPSCYDIYTQIFLTSGSYILALAENPNAPVGASNLSDGFQYDSDPTFNSNNFMGSFGFQGDNHWALDILSVDSASAAGAVPEPSSALLAATGVLLAGLGALRRKRTRV